MLGGDKKREFPNMDRIQGAARRVGVHEEGCVGSLQVNDARYHMRSFFSMSAWMSMGCAISEAR